MNNFFSFVLVSAFLAFSTPALAEKTTPPAPWNDVDQELKQGAKKIKAMLNDAGIETEEDGAKIERDEKFVTHAPKEEKKTEESGLAASLNRGWNKLLTSVNGWLGKERKAQE